MPEMHFWVEWPDGQRERYYSPSYVVEEHLEVGQAYPAAEFMARAARALNEASERVRARYGFACSAALDELARLDERASAFLTPARAPSVRVLAFEKHAPRDARSSGTGDDTGSKGSTLR